MMKWIGILILLYSQSLWAQSDFLNERVSLTYRQTPLREVISDLDNTYPLDFNYFEDEALDKPIDLDIQGETLQNTLELLFESSGLGYLIKGNHVMLKKQMNKLSLSGTVKDKLTGEPLPLAAVSIKGQPVGIISKPDGQFGLMLPSRYRNDTLYVTMLGYKDYEINLAEISNTQQLNIALETDDKLLDEVIIFSDLDKWKLIEPGNTKKTAGKSLPMGLFTTLASLEIPAAGLSLVDLRCGTGTLKIIPSKDEFIKVDAEILTRSITEKETLKYIERYLDLSYKMQGDTVFIRSFITLDQPQTNEKTFLFGNFLGTPGSKINLTVRLPAGLNLKLIDGSGKIQIENLDNDLFLYDRSGKLSVNKINGDVKIVDGSGYLSVSHVKGDLYIKDHSGKMQLKGIKGNLTISDRSGGIELIDVGEENKGQYKIDIKDTSGGIYAKDIHGDVKFIDSSGGIDISNVKGKVFIDDRSGGIHAMDISDTLKVKDRSGKITTDKKTFIRN